MEGVTLTRLLKQPCFDFHRHKLRFLQMGQTSETQTFVGLTNPEGGTVIQYTQICEHTVVLNKYSNLYNAKL